MIAPSLLYCTWFSHILLDKSWTSPNIGAGVHTQLSRCLLTYMQSTSWQMLGWMKRKQESWLLGKISITQDMQMTLTLWQKAAAAKSLQLCLTLCDPTDGSPPGFPSLGFSRQEHWSGLPFPSPKHESEKWKVKSLSHVRLLATPWTAAYQARLWDFPGNSTGVGCNRLLWD